MIHLKKIYAFLLVCALMPVIGSSQTAHTRRRMDFDVHEFKSKKIVLPSFQSGVKLSHIGGIVVVDARADTFPIGFMQKSVSNWNFGDADASDQYANKKPTFLLLQEGVEKETSKFVNNYFHFPGTDSLKVIMVLKKLWLTDELDIKNNSSKEKNLNDKLNRSIAKNEWSSGIIVSIDFYLKNQQDYYPLYHYDSIMNKALTVSENGPEYIQLALISSLAKLIRIDQNFTGLEGKRKLTWDEIKNYNEKRFDIPILRDSVPHAGVYMTYDEFKNNNPSITRFEIKKKKEIQDIYITGTDGKEYLERKMWGYCDGKSAYIRSVEFFFLLQRLNNAFYIYGGKRMFFSDTDTETNPATINTTTVPVPITTHTTNTNNYLFILEPLMLDWDKGSLY